MGEQHKHRSSRVRVTGVRAVCSEVRLEPLEGGRATITPLGQAHEKMPIVDHDGAQARQRDALRSAKLFGLFQELFAHRLRGHCTTSVVAFRHHITGVSPHLSTGKPPNDLAGNMRDNARMLKLAERLRAAMNEGGWTNHSLARAARCDEKTVRAALDGTTASGNASTITKLAAALGVNRDWLATGSGPRTPGESLTEGEKRLIEAYRLAGPGERPVWDRLADASLKSLREQPREQPSEDDAISQKPEGGDDASAKKPVRTGPRSKA